MDTRHLTIIEVVGGDEVGAVTPELEQVVQAAQVGFVVGGVFVLLQLVVGVGVEPEGVTGERA